MQKKLDACAEAEVSTYQEHERKIQEMQEKLEESVETAVAETEATDTTEPPTQNDVNRKRKRPINTPIERKHGLMKNLQALFHFIISIDSVNGWFSIKSAIRSGYSKEHADSSSEKAESFAKGKLETIRKRH